MGPNCTILASSDPPNGAVAVRLRGLLQRSATVHAHIGRFPTKVSGLSSCCSLQASCETLACPFLFFSRHALQGAAQELHRAIGALRLRFRTRKSTRTTAVPPPTVLTKRRLLPGFRLSLPSSTTRFFAPFSAGGGAVRAGAHAHRNLPLLLNPAPVCAWGRYTWPIYDQSRGV